MIDILNKEIGSGIDSNRKIWKRYIDKNNNYITFSMKNHESIYDKVYEENNFNPFPELNIIDQTEKISICYYCENLNNIGGTEWLSIYLTYCINRVYPNSRCEIVCQSISEKFEDLCEYLNIKTSKITNTKEIINYINTFSVLDIINPVWINTEILKNTKIPIICHASDMYCNKLINHIDYISDVISYNNFVEKLYPKLKSKIKYWKIGFDGNKYQSIKEQNFKKYLNTNKKTILWTGRLNDNKNKNIDLLKEIIESNKNLQFIIVGYNNQLVEWQKFVDENNIIWIKDSYPWHSILFLGCADVCLITSNFESFSICGAEAVSAGIPLISTKCIGPEEYIIDGENGFLVENNLESINIAIENINNLNIEHKDYFNIEKSMSDLINIYKQSKKIIIKDKNYKYKIAFICDAPHIGGLHWFAIYTAKFLMDSGFADCRFYFRSSSVCEKFNLYEILDIYDIKYYEKPEKNYDEWFKLKIKEFNPNLIQICWIDPIPESILEIGYSTSFFFAGPPANFLLNKTEKSIDSIICVSETMQNKCLLEKYKHKSRMVYNGIDISKFYKLFDKQKDIMKGLLNIPKNKKIVIWIGRIGDIKQKRPDILMDIIKYFENDDIHFLICGTLNYNYKIWETFVSKQKNISWFSEIHPWNINKYLSVSDIFLSTSDYEGLSIAVLEALATGIPVVATSAIGTSKEMVIDGKNGFVCENGNTFEIISAIEKALDFEFEQFIDEKFDINQYVKNLIDVYEEIIK